MQGGLSPGPADARSDPMNAWAMAVADMRVALAAAATIAQAAAAGCPDVEWAVKDPV